MTTLRAVATEEIPAGADVEIVVNPETFRREVRLASPEPRPPTGRLAAFQAQFGPTRTIPVRAPASVPATYAECHHAVSVTYRTGHWWHIATGASCDDPAPAQGVSRLTSKTCEHALRVVWIQGAWRHVGQEWPGQCMAPPPQGSPVVRP